MSSSPDNIYLDLSITNNDNLGNKLQNIVNFSQTRTNAIIDNPSNYDMSIIRFSMDTAGPNIPIITPLINVDGINSDSNELAYTVTMASVNGSSLDKLTTNHVRYSPEDLSVSLPQNETKTAIVNGGFIYPTINKSFSTQGNNSFNTSTFSGTYPIATTPTEYLGNKVENNAHEFSVVWNVGEFTIAKRPQGDYSYLQINNIPEYNFGYNFTNWTLGRSANLSGYFNVSEEIFEIYWVSPTSISIKVYADFPYVPTLQPGESATFTRPYGDTTAYEIIFTAPLDSISTFPNNTVTSVYPVGANPTVTFNNAGNVYVPPIQTSPYPSITEYLGYFVSPLATVFSRPNYNSISPLQLTTNAPIPTSTNFYTGAFLSVVYANFILYQSTRYTLLTSSTILVNDMQFTTADADLNYNYVIGGLLDAIPNICSQTAVSAINIQSVFNQAMTFTCDIPTELLTIISFTPALTAPQEIVAVGAVVTFDSAIYNLGIPNDTRFAFFGAGGATCNIISPLYKVSSLPTNYQNLNGSSLQFDYTIDGVNYITVTTPPSVEIVISSGVVIFIVTGTYTWPSNLLGGNTPCRNVQLLIVDAAVINRSYGLTTIASVSGGSLTLSAAFDPSDQFPFLYANLITPDPDRFINEFWQTSAQVASPMRMVISLADASTEPLNVPSASIYGVSIVGTNITAYNPIPISTSSYSAETENTTFSPASWILPNIPATTTPNNLHVQYLIVTTITFPQIYNQWTSNLLSISMDGVSTKSVITSQNISNGYYNIYSVQWFLCLVNKCLKDVWSTIEPSYIGLTPYFVVDAGTNLITLLTPQISTPISINFAPSENAVTTSNPVYIGLGSVPPVTHVIFFNEPLYNLFCGINSVYIGSNVPTFINPSDQTIANTNSYLFNYYIQPINYSGLNKSSDGNYIITTSEYSSVPMWSPIKSIQFTSTLLPNLLQYTSTPIPFNNLNHNGLQNIGNNSEISTQITDVQVGLITGSEYKPQILYTPKAQYRLITLLGSHPINSLDFQISFTNKYGQSVPMRLSSQCSANLKILFQRKRMTLKNIEPYNTN